VRIRTRVKNALQGLALAHGIRRGAGLWSQSGQATLTSLRLAPHTGTAGLSCRHCTTISRRRSTHSIKSFENVPLQF
jgi:hypothetical protein